MSESRPATFKSSWGRRRPLGWFVAAAAAQFFCSHALAQQAAQEGPTPTAQADTVGLQEVVVTARYRAESLQQTPIAITALTSTDLDERQFTNVNDIGSSVPNAYFRPPISNYGPTETIGLRGITQVDYSYSFEPAIAIYFDDIYHGTMTGSSMDLADLDHIEVLNGPQGTLFGKNSLGGAIRLVSVKPKGNDTGQIEATYGQHHRMDIKAVGDFALIEDKLFARIMGVSRTEDGIGRYLDFACEMAAKGTPAASGTLPMTVTPTQGNGCALGSLGGYDHKGTRLALRYLATDDLEINATASYSKQADDPPLQTLLTPYGGPTDTFNNNYSATVVFPKYGINYTNNRNFLSPSVWDNYATYGDVVTGQQYDPKQYLTDRAESLVADYHITGSTHAKLILGHEEYQSNWINDSDLTPFGLTQTYNQQEHRQYQAELQLAGALFKESLDWTTGVFYYDSRDRDYYPTDFDAYAAPLLPVFPHGILPNFIANDYYTDKNKSAFLHLNYKLSDRWSFSAGVRYTDENKTNLFQHYNQIVVPYPKAISAARFDYNGSVDFHINPDTMLYGSVATGFRSPGFNPRISTIGQLVEVPGEKGINYEIGSKMDLLDHRLRVNTALFYFDYQSHLTQILATQCNLASDPNAGVPYQLNGGKCPAGTPLAGTPGISPWFYYVATPAIIRGAELQMMANPIEHLSADLTFGYNSTHALLVDPSVKTQPEINMSGGIQYAVPLPVGSITPRLDWYYQSFMTNGPTNLPQRHPDWIVPGYSIFNARLTYTPAKGKWQLAVAGTNIFNKFYWQQLGAATSFTAPDKYLPAVARVGTPGMPREWSVTFTKDF
jgi:iron complex outermembrane receptor protein